MTWKKYMIIALLVVVLLIVVVASAQGSNNAIDDRAKDCRLPRGLRNNNPGNIRYSSANDWRGKIPYDRNTDYNCTTNQVVKAFEQFSEYKYGVRAMIVLVKNYIERGNDTIRKVVTKYAPSSGNNTSGYIDFVADETGIGADETLIANKETLEKIVKAMARKENGSNAINDRQFNQAWNIL
jgi:hypothetical protein